MNRREAIKSAGTVLLGSVIVPRLTADTDASYESAPREGTLTLTMGGPALLRLPKDGSTAALHFVGFPTANVCPQPIHRTMLKMNRATTDCLNEVDSTIDEWRVDGHSIRLSLKETFGAKEFDHDPKSEGIDRPVNNDWSSLKWIPRLGVAVDEAALLEATNADVMMTSGSLRASQPPHPIAQKGLWTWDKLDRWNVIQPKIGDPTLAQHALTDRIQLVGTFTGIVVLTFASRLNPSAMFEMKFRPKKPGGPIDLELTGEPPAEHQQGLEVTPASVYCGYYNLAAKPPLRTDRDVPYLTTPLPEGQAKADHLPPPLCGIFKAIQ